MAVVGVAEVPVRPTFRGFQRDVNRQVSGVGSSFEGKQGRSLGGRLMSGIGTGLKYGALAVGTATAGILSTALVKGWQRMTAIENAEATLKGLGHSAASVEKIMDNALNSVLGTAFGLDEAATVAASAVAAGIEPGQDLEDVLRLTADAATIAGTDMGEMGAIFNKVASSNKIQGDVINQLHERGIPIIQMLAKEMGTSVDETYKLASAGEINFATFRAAMEDGVGGAAASAGETTQGAFANMNAALARFGAQLLVGVFPMAKTVFGGITTLLDNLTLRAEPVVTAFSEGMVAGLKTFRDAWMGTSSDVQLSGFGSFVRRLGEGARSVFDSIVSWIGRFRESWRESSAEVESSGVPGFFERFSFAATGAGGAASIASRILGGLGTVFAGIADVLPGLIRGGLDIVASLIGWIGDNMHIIAPLIPVIAAGFVAWKVATMGLQFAMTRLQMAQVVLAPVMLASNLARITAVRMERSLAVATGQATVATNAKTAALRGQTGAAAGATGAQRGLNAAMRANPIGAIITGITLLVGALLWFFTQTEIGQAIWQRVWGAIQATTSAVVGWFQTYAMPVLNSVWTGISTGLTWMWETVARPVFNFLRSAFAAAVSGISAVWSGVLRPVITAVGAIITWLWRNIAQPYFGFVLSAWRALVSGIAFVWTGVLRPTIQLVGDIFRWLWEVQIRPRLQLIQQRWQVLSFRLRYFYYSTIKPMIDAFGDWVRRLYSNYIQPVLGWISDRWSWLSGKISDFWTGRIRPVLRAFGDFVRKNVVDRVRSGVDMISSAWNTVANIFRVPINWVINTVWNDGIKAAFDGVAKAVGSDARLGRIPTIGRFGGTGGRSGGSSTSGVGGGAAFAAARAKGGPVSAGTPYLVGEEGPEIITPSRYGWVHTAEETAAMQGGTDSLVGGIGDGWISSAWNWTVDKVSGAVDWVRGKLADTAEAVLKPILDGVSGFVSEYGLMGQLGSGLIDHGVEQVLDWIRGKDEEVVNGTYDGVFEANPGGFNRPAQGPVTSRAGSRSYQGAFGGMHYGVDIGNRIGTAIRAAYDGVVRSTSGSGLDQRIVLNHGSYDTAYFHNSELLASPGQRVSGGDMIARMGSAGTGPHLHFEYHPGGWYNPSIRGVNNLVRDEGGLLYPGINHTLNATGRPEYSFNERDFGEVRRIIRGGGTGNTGLTVIQHGLDGNNARENVNEFMRAKRRMDRGGKFAGVSR